jgi:hypothetical protein
MTNCTLKMQQNLIKRDSSSGHWYVRGNSTRGSKASFKDFLVKCLMTSCILILLFMYLEWTFLLEGKFVTMRKHKTLYSVKPLIFGFSGHHNFFFFFWRYWGLNSELHACYTSILHLSHTPSPFYFSLFFR